MNANAQLVENNPDAIWIIQNGVIAYVNAACLRLIGADTAEQLLGRSPFEFLPWEYHDFARWQFARARTESTGQFVEEKLCRRDGSQVDVEIWAAPFEAEEGPAIHVVLRDITERKRTQAEILRLQRSLVSELIEAQDEERRTLAYDLHDGVTQYVLAANAHLQACVSAWNAGDTGEARGQFALLEQYLNQAAHESRRLVNGLRSLTLEELGLPEALEQLVQEEKKRAGWSRATLWHNMAAERLGYTIETAVFRVAQEALANIRKHAQARQVAIRLTLTPDPSAATWRVALAVSDDGVGFSPGTVPGGGVHVGLRGMGERIRRLGGTFTVESAPGEGTTLHACVPVVEVGV